MMNLGEVFNPYQQFVGSFIPAWLERRSELSPGAKLVYARLCRYAGKSGMAFPNQHTLAAALGMSERTLREYLHELRKHRLIRSQQRGNGRSNGYVFLYHAWIEEAIERKASAPGSLEQESAWQNLPPCAEPGEQPGRICRCSPAESAAPVLRESGEEIQTHTHPAREDEPQAPEDETPCVCEDASTAEDEDTPPSKCEALPEPEPMPEPEPSNCTYNPIIPCAHYQSAMAAIQPLLSFRVMGNGQRVNEEVFEAAHRLSPEQITRIYRFRIAEKHRPEVLYPSVTLARKSLDKWHALAEAWEQTQKPPAACKHLDWKPVHGRYVCLACGEDQGEAVDKVDIHAFVERFAPSWEEPQDAA